MAQPTAPAPSHLIFVALLLLLWHGVLGADYVIERFALGEPGWPALMSALPLDALWMRVVWALGVWLGVAAALFLALKDDASVLLFFAAAAANVALAVGLILNAPPVLLLPLPLPALLGLLVVVPLMGWLYARTLNRAGVLH
ncbi:hypothetical protein [Pararhodobacter zhoushanensis]|uniref:DoxX-like family protein n=1 Tax=Pararhodobacter zhoushanensis TaxID=2479545 RepID=A0ABT3H3Q4_9RHOB|nr:hypothetical protein [Pararhodobacter zhoushanensis]MCW1934418.1 hypothetical protein [Pararhodobacter zhoushanensis]